MSPPGQQPPPPPRRSLLPKAEPSSHSASTSPIQSGAASISNSDIQPAKRRCVSSACMPCRKRKSKCDGVQPSCHACAIVYGSDCFYDIDSDHRRKGALKRDISQLKSELGPINAILDAIKKGSEADVDDIIQLIRSNQDENWDLTAESARKITQSTAETKPSAYLSGALDTFSVRTSTKPGEAHQYGHTSNLHLVGEEPGSRMSEVMQPGSWTNVTKDGELVHHLIQVYLTWGSPLYTFFSEELFMHGLQDRKMKYCTPLLVNAVLAFGCHFSDRPETRANPSDPTSTGDHFYAEAERLLREDSRPCLTTVQSLGIMSLHQAMNNRDSSGWSLMCQTMGMVIELGLHKEAPPNGDITPSEAVARRITFWGTYFLQTVWAICVGRITFLPRTAIRIEKPTVLDHLEQKPWRPHGHAEHAGQLDSLEQPGYRHTLMLHTIYLCEFVDDIVQLFYAPRDRVTSRRLQAYHEKLQTWYRNLPECLAIKRGTPTLPQVICLHVYYHNCVIQLFRPFIKVSFVQSEVTPRQICKDSAVHISQLLVLYRQTYGCRRMSFLFTHCLMTAVVIHLVTMSGNNIPAEVSGQTETYIADIIRALHELHQSFAIVERYLKAIRALAQRWFVNMPVNIADALADAEVGSPSSTTSSQPVPVLNASQSVNTVGRKPSAPELFLPFSQFLNSNDASHFPPQPQQQPDQHFFWTPFPGASDGVPLALPQDHTPINQLMDISSMLDSGIDGDWPQLNRDGFTVAGDDEASLWNMHLDAMGVNDGLPSRVLQ